MTTATNDRAIEWLVAILEELRALRDHPERRRKRLSPRDRAALAVILPLIAVAIGDRAFTVHELMEHGTLPTRTTLRMAIERVGDARKLGRLLRRGEGVDIDGYRL